VRWDRRQHEQIDIVESSVQSGDRRPGLESEPRSRDILLAY